MKYTANRGFTYEKRAVRKGEQVDLPSDVAHILLRESVVSVEGQAPSARTSPARWQTATKDRD